MRLVVFGPQGAGKGTQSARISEKFGIPAISTGEIFRWAISSGTPLGAKVREYVESGQLVPDDLTLDVVRERLSEDDAAIGWLLDGYPRNIAQAESLDELLKDEGHVLDGAIVIEVPDDVALKRILGRGVCSNCGRNYSAEHPPKDDQICDACGGEVVPRVDDTDEPKIRRRLELYHRMTEPLKAHYEGRNLLERVDGQGSPTEVFDRIVAAL